MKLDQIVHLFSNYCLELMKSRQFLEFVSFQFIIVTWDMLDQYSIVDCDSVVEKRSFHWNGSVVSYSLFA